VQLTDCSGPSTPRYFPFGFSLLASKFVQIVLVWVADLKIYDYTKMSMWYWGPLNGAKALVYLVLLTLPLMKCCCKTYPSAWRCGLVPDRLLTLDLTLEKKGFYFYSALLLAIHILHVVGDVLISFQKAEVGFWCE